MLRTTTEAFSGVVGGCDSMQVGPFDEVVRFSDEFSRRIARNTQLILHEECRLDRVIDPAGGSWFIERLTADLAKGGWELFQEVERRGGMAAAMRAGFPQSEIAAAAAVQAKKVAQRSKIIVGTNQYVHGPEEPLPGSNFDGAAFRKKRAAQIEAYRTSSDNRRNTEVMAGLSRIVEAGPGEVLEACVAAVRAGATLGEVTRTLRIQDRPDEPMPPVTICRVTEGYERLRLAVIEHGRRAGGRPKVFLAAMGPLRQHKARADFSRGFFEVAGFSVVGGTGYADVGAAAAAAAESGAAIVVICSTDETYPDLVPPLAGALRAKMPGVILVLAGYPKDQVEAHKASGVDEFIHIRSDALETLTRLAKRAGLTV
jgi:methylmalonyl-CoA mutase